ncbi:hypothetical protein GE061_010585 [Apolygus lucorum]|uniref:Alpha-2-macroglobulin receptor-associated protein n=1 Tax=Apolygus lucorum TaxID=248454 RepID=A0A8S9XZ40_APOLU|nr:hypothetical protein GE061_010585 [Apolygus lucorum]
MLNSKHLFVVLLFISCAFVSCNKYDKNSNEYYKKDYQREQYKRDKDTYKQAQKDYLNDDYQRKTAYDPSQFDDFNSFDIRKMNKPFRMAKLNLLWTKAVSRLTEPKLKSLFSELKVHDKEEMQWKRLAAEGSDKDGLLEAELRRKLSSIMNVYGLLEHFEDVPDARQFKPHDSYSGRVDDHLNRHLFRDKKLNKLWEKAERSGFTPEELRMLKEEFDHHQLKVDQYYSILNTVEAGDPDTVKNSIDEKLDRFNELDQLEESDPVSRDYLAKVIQLRDSHKTIRDDYDRLYRLAMSGPDNQEFIEPKVQGLWKLAITANFKPDELESIRSELQHYEKRLLKLRRMHLDAAVGQEKNKFAAYQQNIHYPGSFSEDEIKHQTRKHWTPVLRNAKKTGKPFIVNEVATEEVVDLKQLEADMQVKFKINSDKEKVLWTEMKVIRIVKGESKLKYKTDHRAEEFKEICFERRRAPPRSPPSKKLSPAYKKPPKIPAAKAKDLCQNNIIPKVHYSFYKSVN